MDPFVRWFSLTLLLAHFPTHTLTVLASRPTPYRLAARSRAQRINSLSSPNRLKNQDCQPLREESKFEDALVRSLARFSLGKQVMPLTLEGLPPLNSKIAHGIMQRDVKYTPTRPHSLGDTGKNTLALNTRSNLFEYFTAQFFPNKTRTQLVLIHFYLYILESRFFSLIFVFPQKGTQKSNTKKVCENEKFMAARDLETISFPLCLPTFICSLSEVKILNPHI
jgi:hypothetical protein